METFRACRETFLGAFAGRNSRARDNFATTGGEETPRDGKCQFTPASPEIFPPPPSRPIIGVAGPFQVAAAVAQDYEVSDIQCSGAGSAADLLTAKIKRPVGFRGAPLFADDRSANPLADIHCQIRPDPNDPQEDNYFLKVTDFSRCGILKRNVSHPAIERVTRNAILQGGGPCPSG